MCFVVVYPSFQLQATSYLRIPVYYAHMHSIPHGYTWKEVITSFAVIGFAVLVIVIAINPQAILEEERDVVREEAVRDIMENVLEMRVEEPEAFAQIIGTVASGQVMIGSAYECAGDFGSQCSDVVLRDSCIDLSTFGDGELFSETPVDPSSDYAPRQTGYYLYLENKTLEVGACNPERRDEIKLEAHLE